MAQYILIAGLPIYILNELHGGEMEAGIAMTFFQIGTVFCRPFAGGLIDSHHKQRLLFISLLIFFFIMVGFSFAFNEQMIYGLRLLHGIDFALGTTTTATLAALVLPPEKKGTGIGYFALATNLAMVVGPLFGVVLIRSLGSAYMFGFLAVIALLSLYLGNRKRLADDIVLPKASGQKWSLKHVIEKGAVPAAILGGLTFFAYGGMLTFIPLFARSLGLEADVSYFFLVFALSIVVTRPLVGYAFDKFGPNATVYPGLLIFAVGFRLFGTAYSEISLLLAALVLGIGFGAASPAFQTLAVQSVAKEKAGAATATYFWALDISVGFAAFFLGQVAESYGYSFLYGIVSPIPPLVAIVIYALWRRSMKKRM